MRLRQIKISPPSYWISRPTRRKLLLSVKKLILFTRIEATPDFKMQKAYEETSSENQGFQKANSKNLFEKVIHL